MVMSFRENNRAIFLQIADRICDDILSRKLLPEQRIPSVREYAAEVEVNANTVMRAYEYLAQSDVIFNRRGIGFFVAGDAVEKITLRRRREFLDDELYDIFKQLHLLGVTPDELATLYNNYITI